MTDENNPYFARSQHANPYGKCSEEAKTHVPNKVHDDLVALAVAANGNKGSYLHDLIMGELYGKVGDDTMKQIAWEHVTKHTDSELIRAVMFTHIFGRVHEFRIANAATVKRDSVGRFYALNGGRNEN
jgi:hypothetical protein